MCYPRILIPFFAGVNRSFVLHNFGVVEPYHLDLDVACRTHRGLVIAGQINWSSGEKLGHISSESGQVMDWRARRDSVGC